MKLTGSQGRGGGGGICLDRRGARGENCPGLARGLLGYLGKFFTSKIMSP